MPLFSPSRVKRGAKRVQKVRLENFTRLEITIREADVAKDADEEVEDASDGVAEKREGKR